jgi:glyoxylase-like metal-dependent hydrolase (beta-lactamase superfamily II)
VPARRLLDTVWLVGSGTDSDATTDPHDCHCYLVWDGTGGFLVDAGTGIAADRWLGQVGEVCDPARLGGVLLTHYHADHAGGAAAAAGAGLAVLGSATTAEALGAADEARTALRLAREVGVYPADYRLRPAPVRPVAPGPLTSGGVTVTVVDAPGHCDGHVVVRTESETGPVLFSGDCLFAGGRVGIQAIADCRLDRYRSTLAVLAEDPPDVLLPGHEEPVLGGAASDVRRAADAFRRLVPPPNLLVPW